MTEEELDKEMLRTLALRTAQLPREIEPPSDAWEKISAQIASERHAVLASAARTSWWQRPAYLAAAALLLVAGSSVVTAIAMNGRVRVPRAAATGRSVAAVPRAAPASLAEFTARENDYIGTANRLTAILESEEGELAPETVMKLKESIRVIDAAILEARRALAQDPSNKALMEMLTASYGQKVDLLQRTTEMGRS